MLNRELKLTQPEGDEPLKVSSVLFRKWSAMKLVTMFEDVEEIGAALGDDFSFDKSMAPPEIARMIHVLGEKIVRKIAKLIKESVQKPDGITVEDVLAWELDDFVSAIMLIVEMNFTDGLRKNFGRLRGVLQKAIGGGEVAANGSKKVEIKSGVQDPRTAARV